MYAPLAIYPIPCLILVYPYPIYKGGEEEERRKGYIPLGLWFLGPTHTTVIHNRLIGERISKGKQE
jgi:hypothetical protein